MLKSLNIQVATYNSDKPEVDQIIPLDEQAEAWLIFLENQGCFYLQRVLGLSRSLLLRPLAKPIGSLISLVARGVVVTLYLDRIDSMEDLGSRFSSKSVATLILSCYPE